MKPTVYIETSIVSYLTANLSNDIRVLANQNITVEWWNNSRGNFDLYISELVTTEASGGDKEAAKRRLDVIEGLPELEVSENAESLAKALCIEGPVPQNAEIDAYHIAVATVNGMDYLLTWNCAHIANAVIRPKLEEVCYDYNYQLPVICTPQELLEE